LGAVGPEVLERLRPLQPATLGPLRSRLAARAALEAGELCRKARLEPEAIEAYKLALRFEDLEEARGALGRIYAARAEALREAGKDREAARTAETGLSFCPADAALLGTRRRALRRRLLRRALWAGIVLAAAAGLALALLDRHGEGLFGEAPTGPDLVRSFGSFLRSQESVTNFVARDSGRDLSFDLGNSRWRVVVRGATVTGRGNGARPLRGTLDTWWERDGRPVTDLRSMPPELTRLGIGARLNAAPYNPHSRRWSW
jgi:hypothetical protein